MRRKILALLIAGCMVLQSGVMTLAEELQIEIAVEEVYDEEVVIDEKHNVSEKESETIFDDFLTDGDLAEEIIFDIVDYADTSDMNESAMELYEVGEEYGVVIASGKCGATSEDNVSWTAYDTDSNGEEDLLVISGSGAMKDNWNSGYKEVISKLTVEEGVTTIGNSAFYECENLTSVQFSEGLKTIGMHAFAYCNNLEEVVLPESVESIGACAFYHCTLLEKVIFPKCLTRIEDQMFNYCSYLKDVTLPQNLESIGSYAFARCLRLGKINIPASVISIESYAFYDCDNLNKIVLPEGVISIGAFAFRSSGLLNVDLPQSLEKIGNGVFAECRGLSGVDSSVIIRNRLCNIYDDKSVFYSGTKIIGYSNSTAEQYAKKYGYNFKALKCEEHIEVIIDGVKASCTENGLTDGMYCSLCGETLVTQEVIPAGHEVVIDRRIEATCDQDGVTEGKHCVICGEILVAQEVIPAAHKVMIDEAVEVTCEKNGLTKGEHCYVCGDILVAQNIIPAPGHTVVIDEEVSATCNETGLTEGKHCAVCNEILLAQNIVPAKGHTYKEEILIAPTCEVDGKKMFVCENCGDSYNEKMDAFGHTEVVDEAISATCDKDGLTEGSHCSVCDKIFVAQEIIPAGHQYQMEVTKEPTCQVKGEKMFTCTKCGDRYVEEILASHMEMIDEAEKATCEKNGLTEGSHCSVCGETLIAQEVILAFGHMEVIDKEIPATCVESGLTEGKHCSVCNKIIVAQEIIPSVGHSYESQITTEPTCTEKGVKITVCNNCGNQYAEEVVAWGHDEVIDQAIPATCIEDGLTEGVHCLVCREILIAQEVIPASHKEVIIAGVDETCTENGLTEGKYCAVCEQVLVEQEVILAGHIEVINERIEANCTETGLTEGKCCSRCDEVLMKQEMIPATGHLWETEYTVDVEATYTESGSKSIHCSVCDISKEDSIVGIPMKESSITLDQESVTLQIGDIITLNATVKPEIMQDELIWSSDDTAVATVTPEGSVSAVGMGECTVKAEIGNGVFAQCKVEVCNLYYIRTNKDWYGLDDITGKTTCILEEDISPWSSVTISEDAEIILELNGHRIDTSSRIENNGILTIKDSSKEQNGTIEINNYAGPSSMLKNTGTLNILSGCIRYYFNDTDTKIWVDMQVIDNAGVFNFEGGKIIVDVTAAAYIQDIRTSYISIEQCGILNRDNGKLNMSGGMVVSKASSPNMAKTIQIVNVGIKNQSLNTIIISDGSVCVESKGASYVTGEQNVLACGISNDADASMQILNMEIDVACVDTGSGSNMFNGVTGVQNYESGLILLNRSKVKAHAVDSDAAIYGICNMKYGSVIVGAPSDETKEEVVIETSSQGVSDTVIANDSGIVMLYSGIYNGSNIIHSSDGLVQIGTESDEVNNSIIEMNASGYLFLVKDVINIYDGSFTGKLDPTGGCAFPEGYCHFSNTSNDYVERGVISAHQGVVVSQAGYSCTGIKIKKKCSLCNYIWTEAIPGTSEDGHSMSAPKLISNASVFKPKQYQSVCRNNCGYSEKNSVGKELSPTIKLTDTKITLKVKQATTGFIVSGLANGDAIKSIKLDSEKYAKLSNVNLKKGTFKITALKKKGNAKLTITLASGLKKNVPVTIQTGAVKTTKITGISSKLTLKKGAKLTLKPGREPFTSAEKFKYTTSNKKVVKVTSKGQLTAVAPGTAKITIKAGKKSARCTVTVPGITGIKTSATVKVKKSTTLKPKLYGISGKATFISSNPAVVTVNASGKVTGVKKGSATITIKAGSYNVKCKVKVK